VTDRKPPGMSFETWVDSQIRRAQDEGAFENLEGAGRPLPRRHAEKSSYEWALEWARRENVDPIGMLPPGLALRREKQDLPALLLRLSSESAVRAAVEDLNARIELYWRRPAEGPQVPIGQVDVDEAVRRWRAERPSPPPPPPAPVAVLARPWWRRLLGR
jgi:hypothetical protein